MLESALVSLQGGDTDSDRDWLDRARASGNEAGSMRCARREGRLALLPVLALLLGALGLFAAGPALGI